MASFNVRHVLSASLQSITVKPGFHSNAIACVNENRKRLRWQAANNGCHCFDRAFLLAGACVCCALAVFVYATQAISFEWKPGLTFCLCCSQLVQFISDRQDSSLTQAGRHHTSRSQSTAASHKARCVLLDARCFTSYIEELGDQCCIDYGDLLKRH